MLRCWCLSIFPCLHQQYQNYFYALNAPAEEKQKIKASVQVAMQRPDVQGRLRSWQGRTHSSETKVTTGSLPLCAPSKQGQQSASVATAHDQQVLGWT